MRPRNSAGQFEAKLDPSEVLELEKVSKDLVIHQLGPIMREIAREEIASLCGLVLRRTQNRPGMAMRTELAVIFGEALRDFTDEHEPGDAA